MVCGRSRQELMMRLSTCFIRGVLPLLVAATLGAVPASAQVSRASGASVVGAAPQLPVPTPSPSLAGALATKKRFDPARLAPSLSLVDGVPTLRVANGKSVKLMPVDTMTG